MITDARVSSCVGRDAENVMIYSVVSFIFKSDCKTFSVLLSINIDIYIYMFVLRVSA